MRVLLVGDSTAMALGAGLVEWAAQRPDDALVSIAATPGCGFLRGGAIGLAIAFEEACDDLLDVQLPSALGTLQPDVVVLFSTLLDVDDRMWSAGEGVLSPSDPLFRARLLAAYDSMATDLSDAGVRDVVWIVPVVPNAGMVSDQSRDPARHRVVRGVIEEIASERPELVTVVDLQEWMRVEGVLADASYRPDGLHLGPDAALEISEELVGPAILGAALS